MFSSAYLFTFFNEEGEEYSEKDSFFASVTSDFSILIVLKKIMPKISQFKKVKLRKSFPNLYLQDPHRN
jgi:hypothetical protein